ncbi:probable G-protein coupled receptor 139 [Chiloscyllium plagiosum]|uniref:probable G-protein coupled receptor 139 n=1 Tax=Chiloscyllium plagiosum TaxID=36176 RepID=UPI001CB7CF5A|nr:probable G-protein coupled receptor 139 [Chiloscyllium plagiosum]
MAKRGIDPVDSQTICHRAEIAITRGHKFKVFGGKFRRAFRINLVTIAILARGKCGISTCTTRYLLAIATVDILVVTFEIILSKIKNDYFPPSFLDITPMCSVRYVLRRAIIHCSVWFTIAFTFDRYVTICCEKLKAKYCNEKTATVVSAAIGSLLCLKNIPIYFRFEPYEIINNVPWYCSNRDAYSDDPVWQGFNNFEKILTPILPFGLILFLNALTVKHIIVTNRFPQGLKGQSKGDKCSDPEMESRRQCMVLLFAISGSFIFMWLWYILYYFDVDEILDSDGQYTFKVVAYVLRNLNCCTNAIVYVASLPRFREKLKNPLEAIFT